MPRTTPDAQGRSVRLLRIGEQVRHAIAEVLARGDLRDDLLSHSIVTVSEVRVSPDLRHATVFVKGLAAEDDHAIVKASGGARRLSARRGGEAAGDQIHAVAALHARRKLRCRGADRCHPAPSARGARPCRARGDAAHRRYRR